MRAGKAWTHEQDEVLRLLIEQRGEIRWSVVARIMQQQFAIAGKTGKKCRQRYHNHLKADITNSHWTPREDQALLTLHHQFGNKWASIAQLIPGRSQNCVKNRFYSKLRKVSRKLNHFNTEKHSQHPSGIQVGLISKIVSVSESRFRTGPKISEEWIQFCTRLVNTLYTLESNPPQNQTSHPHNHTYAAVISDIAYFEQNFRKKKIIRNKTSEDDYKQRINSQPLKDREVCRRSRSHQFQGAKPQPLRDQGEAESPVRQMGENSSNSKMESEGEMELNSEYQQLKIHHSTFESFEELENQMEKMDLPIAMFEESEEYPYFYRELSL